MGIPSRPRNGISLCGGAGGLDLGLSLAEPGFSTRCWVEIEEYPRDCIIAGQRAGYFAPAPIWTDLRTFDARPWAGRIDTLLAGYPCQPFSAAGKRLGEDDERHLWPEVARCARELGPGLEWIFLENVAGHVSLGLETVLRELWDMGFTPAAGLFSAGETGAAHERLRIFIVAHRRHPKRRTEDAGWHHDHRQDAGWPEGDGRSGKCGGDLGHAQGLGRREGRPEPDIRSGWDTSACTGGAMADACCERRQQIAGSASGHEETHGRARRIECQSDGDHQPSGSGESLADACSAGLEGRERSGSPAERHGPAAHGPAAECGRPWVHAPGPADTAGWSEALRHAPYLAPAVSLREVKRAADRLAALVACGVMAESAAESQLRLLADGMANRARALRVLGNGVAPLSAAYAWRELSRAHGLEPSI